MFKRCAVAAALLAATAGTAQAQVRAGGEVLVNTYTTARQWFGSAAVEPDGDFVVVWESYPGQDGDASGVFGQRYDRTGAPRGSEFQVNTYTTNYQQYLGRIGVGTDRLGRFVVAWASYTQDGEDWGLFARRFTANGVGVGTEFQVDTNTAGAQGGFYGYNELGLSMSPKGNFVVVWESSYAGYNVYGQRYDSQGNRQGAIFQANTTGYAFMPEVSMNQSGAFVVSWVDTTDGSQYGISAKRYDSAGAPMGDVFQVNTYTTGAQGLLVLLSPGVALADAGNFAIVWNSSGQDGSGYGVFGQAFSASGAPVGAEFQANTYTTLGQVFPAARGDANGNFVVTWQSNLQDGNSYGTFAQRFTAAGVRRGAEFLVNTYTTNFQGVPNIATDQVGNFNIVWHGNGAVDTSDNGVTFQRHGGLIALANNVDTPGNRVAEPGETVDVRPVWSNVNGASQTFAATLANAAGPPGGVPTILDGVGDYGTVANGAVALCTNCYSVSFPNPTPRPGLHWDGSAVESLTPDLQGQQKTWLLHVGNSFTDVPLTNGFYRFIETLLHHGVSTGCGGTNYCPGDFVTREQIPVFVLVAKEGSGYAPPACTTPVFTDVPASSGFCRFIEELVRRGVVTGCGGTSYCPSDPVTREQMAVFVLRTLDESLNPPACGTPMFNDVPASSPFCRWVEELARRGVVTGCGGGNFCPTDGVTREQMAVFISVTFGLNLYGI